MRFDKDFLHWLDQAHFSFTGWDFSFISETGRVQSELLPWSYGSLVIPLVTSANSMLDMGTGGGEFLSFLRPYPKKIFATEGYGPNVPIAKKKLEPLGVQVVEITDDNALPFEDNVFDLILNQHESYAAREVRRIIKTDGIFMTQQVGGLNGAQINEALECPINEAYAEWNLKVALEELKDNHFKILYQKEDFPIERFYDIGALVYYLKAIPWQVPDFSIDDNLDKLYHIHHIIKEKGYFDVKKHRSIIKAVAV